VDDFDLGDDIDDIDDIANADDTDWNVKLDCGPCECGRRYPGSDRNGGHCATCHLSFASQTGFDKHRVGRYNQTPSERRCLTREELTAKGWTVDEHFVVRMPAPDHAPAFWNTTTREETE